MSGLRKRYMLDLAMSIMIIVEMLYQFTGNTIHEIIGAVFAITVVVHLVLSRKWIGATGRQISQGRHIKAQNKLKIALAIGLAVSFVALLISSVMISNLLMDATESDLAGGAYAAWVIAHEISSYVLCGLTLVHLLTHWASAASAFRIPYNPARRTAINTGVGVIAAAGIAMIAASGVEPISNALARQFAMESTGNKKTNLGNSNDADTNTDDIKPNEAPTPLEENEPQPERKHKEGKRFGNGEDRRGGLPEDPGSDSGSKGNEFGKDSGTQDNSSENSGDTQDGSGSKIAPSGYCTLCRIRCPLSEPQCNKPYRAGLI